LVMVDQIKVENASIVLNISPKEIDRIEIVKEPYTRGDITYGGIIHFITKSRKFETLKFPEESIFLEYNLLTKTTATNQNDAIPGYPKIGNCLYWNPSIKVSVREETIIDFNTGDEPANYEIIIEGIDNNSAPFQIKKSFVVSPNFGLK
jgi:hypothetical protein